MLIPEGSQVLMNIFNWSSLHNDSFDSHYNLSKVILRLYKDGNFSKDCSRATLQAKVYCKHDTGESEFTGVSHRIDLSNGRHWEELDLTEQFKSLWPIPYKGNLVYVTLTLKSRCVNNKLPIKLYDLKSISKLKLRRKLYANQPVLCLYLKDDMTEKLARNAAGHVQSIPNDEVLSLQEDDLRREKRGTQNHCRKDDHTINFKELNIDYVILPIEFNAGKCVGTCNLDYLINAKDGNYLHKVNNYSKMMAAQGLIKNSPDTAVCCSPGEYDPLMLLISSSNGASVRQKMFHEMRVRYCSCR